MKKKYHNEKRGKTAKDATGSNSSAGETPAGSGCNADTVSYVRSVTSLIEGRQVSRQEIEQMLERVMRQHSLESAKGKDYILRYLKNNDP